MQKIIFLYGPSCSGKSKISEEILKNENFFHVHHDRIKWFISDYHRDNKIHRSLIAEIMMSLIKQSFDKGFSILIEGLSLDLFEEVNQKYKAQARVIPIYVIASKEVLEKRFLERVESAKNSNRKISNLSLDVFWQVYEKFSQKLGYGETIDTSEISVAETLEEVNSYIN